VLNSLGGPLAMFLNGVGAIRWQACSASAMAVANLGLSIWLAREVGVAGVVIGTVAAQLAFIFLPYLFYIPRLLRSLEQTAPVSMVVQ
jgi:hypothetical protein